MCIEKKVLPLEKCHETPQVAKQLAGDDFATGQVPCSVSILDFVR